MSKIITDEKLIDKVLSRGVEDIVEKEHLKDALLSGKQLRVKFGIDPTGSDLHLGHAVPLRKLKEFQDLGHKIVLIIGDFTAKIGDPTGRSKERVPLTDEDVKSNMKNYLKQAGKIIDLKKTEINYNSKWFLKEGVKTIIELSRAGSIQQVLRRADFKKRISEGSDITLLETLYPLFTGYDSVKVKADLEIGGNDQLFNVLMGRKVQRYYDIPEQDILTVPLLVGTDGVKKMSKSSNNYISLSDKPFDILEEIMHMPDISLSEHAYSITNDEVAEEWIKSFESKENLRNKKLELAESVVAMYYPENDVRKAREEYEKRSEGRGPTDVAGYTFSKEKFSLPELLLESRLVSSKSEGRRLVEQGGVSVDDAIHKDPKEIITFKGGEIVKVGKRRCVLVNII